MTSGLAWSLPAALVLAAVQMLPRFLPVVEDESRSRWLSAAGGFSVSFVFLHLLPELERAGEPVADALGHLMPFTEHEPHVLALAGLIAVYGLERLARRTGPEAEGEARIVRVSIGAFAVYYSVVGYLLWNRAAEGIGELATFTVAMALHFLVVDFGLRNHHRDTYRRWGRSLLSLGVLVGWGIGLAATLPDNVIGVLLSLLSGGVILLALKEELPAERTGRFGAFTLGAALYALILFATPT